MQKKSFKVFQWVSLASAVLASSACGGESDTGVEDTRADDEIVSTKQAIIGGSLVNIGTRRNLGLVDLPGCSGSLAHPDWVLTATHCVDTSNPSATTFSIPRFDGTLDRRVGRSVVRMGPTSDVSLVELEPGAPGNQWPTVFRNLHSGAPTSLVNQQLTCYGRGNTGIDPTDGIGLVGFGQWRTLTKTVARFDGAYLIINATASGSEIAALGDSGGVCFFGNQVAAIVSNTSTNCLDRTSDASCKATITKVLSAGLSPIGEFGSYIDSLPGRRQILQIAGVTSETNRHLLHVLRQPNGAWTSFGDVEGVAGDIGTPVKTAIFTNGAGESYVAAINTNWDVFQAIRRPDGSWRSWRNVETAAGSIGNAATVTQAGVGSDTHVLATNQNGNLYHGVRLLSGAWQPFGDVEGVAGDIGRVVDVAASGSGNELHVCVRSDNLNIYHTMRLANGAWTPFFRVTTDQSTSLSCTVINGTLHMLRVRQAGFQTVLEHRTRNPAGAFSAWGSVNGATSSTLSFNQVSSSEVGSDLHVVANSSGRLYHSIRSTATTNWTTFGDVNAATGFSTTFGDSDSD